MVGDSVLTSQHCFEDVHTCKETLRQSTVAAVAPGVEKQYQLFPGRHWSNNLLNWQLVLQSAARAGKPFSMALRGVWSINWGHAASSRCPLPANHFGQCSWQKSSQSWPAIINTSLINTPPGDPLVHDYSPPSKHRKILWVVTIGQRPFIYHSTYRQIKKNIAPTNCFTVLHTFLVVVCAIR